MMLLSFGKGAVFALVGVVLQSSFASNSNQKIVLSTPGEMN